MDPAAAVRSWDSVSGRYPARDRNLFSEALPLTSGIRLGRQAPAVEVPQDDGGRFRSL